MQYDGDSLVLCEKAPRFKAWSLAAVRIHVNKTRGTAHVGVSQIFKCGVFSPLTIVNSLVVSPEVGLVDGTGLA